MIRQTFSPEFKHEAVRLLEQGDKEGSQLARELGIKRNQLYKWQAEIRSYGDDAFPGCGRRPLRDDDTKMLKAEIKRLHMENEILKKAAVYFVKEVK